MLDLMNKQQNQQDVANCPGPHLDNPENKIPKRNSF